MHSKINRGKCCQHSVNTVYANHKGKHYLREISSTIKNWSWIVLTLPLAGSRLYCFCVMPGSKPPVCPGKVA